MYAIAIADALDSMPVGSQPIQFSLVIWSERGRPIDNAIRLDCIEKDHWTSRHSALPGRGNFSVIAQPPPCGIEDSLLSRWLPKNDCSDAGPIRCRNQSEHRDDIVYRTRMKAATSQIFNDKCHFNAGDMASLADMFADPIQRRIKPAGVRDDHSVIPTMALLHGANVSIASRGIEAGSHP